jgi:hypothetical protein
VRVISWLVKVAEDIKAVLRSDAIRADDSNEAASDTSGSDLSEAAVNAVVNKASDLMPISMVSTEAPETVLVYSLTYIGRTRVVVTVLPVGELSTEEERGIPTSIVSVVAPEDVLL